MASGAGDWGREGIAEAGGGEVGEELAVCGRWGAGLGVPEPEELEQASPLGVGGLESGL